MRRPLYPALAVVGLVLAALLPHSASSGATGSETRLAEIGGRYSGAVLGDGRPYPIDVTFSRTAGGDLKARANYGGRLNCRGAWHFLRKDGREVRLRERIVFDPGANCIQIERVFVYALKGSKVLAVFPDAGGYSRAIVSPS